MNKNIDTAEEARDQVLRKIDPLKEVMTADKVLRVLQGLQRWKDYFAKDKTSATADKLEASLNFLALESPGARIERLLLYSFDRFYRPDGEARVAREIERIRKSMIRRARGLHAFYDGYVRIAIHNLKKELSAIKDDKEKSESKKKEETAKATKKIEKLEAFLKFPGNLEIKNAALNEISSRLKARSIRRVRDLNRAPDGGITRMALRDCTLEAYFKDGKMAVHLVPFNPGHLLTYAINASLFNEEAAEQAREWWDFTMKSMGYEGARKFYEHVGFILVTEYPLPTERTILYVIGHPGSSKGTHLGAVESLLSFDTLTMFAKASPHKLTDPKEHFSRQNLQNKLALISGDLTHKKIRDYSEVNDLFGGEPQEMERKFRDPTTEVPTFKAIWASTLPLHRIDQAGGAWRRISLILTKPVSEKNRDDGLKKKMLALTDGFLLNAIIGLAYLVQNNWRFTGAQSDEAIEELWEFHSDSVQVWAQNLNPEPEQVESKAEIKTSSLEGEKSEKVMVENVAARLIIDDLYEEYGKWCGKKQIEPVKPKTFTAWLSNHEYAIKKRLLEEGQFKGKRKMVTYAAWNDEDEAEQNFETDRTQGNITWEAYFSKAPITFVAASDSRGHVNTRVDGLKNNSNNVTYRLPSWIGRDPKQSRNTGIIGFGDNQDPRPILFEDQNIAKETDPSNLPEELPNPEPAKQFSEDRAREIIDGLLKDGYHVSSKETGFSIDKKSYKIAITKPTDSTSLEALKHRMNAEGYSLVNTGAHGPLFFLIEAKGSDKNEN